MTTRTTITTNLYQFKTMIFITTSENYQNNNKLYHCNTTIVLQGVMDNYDKHAGGIRNHTCGNFIC
jgi:hypothetical protein